MQRAAFFIVIVALGTVLTVTLDNAVAQVVVSSSSSANGNVNFGNPQPAPNHDAVLAAVITGFFGIFGTVLTLVLKQNKRRRSPSKRYDGNKEDATESDPTRSP